MNTHLNHESISDGTSQLLSHEPVVDAGAALAPAQSPPANYERWSKLPKARGRQPRDPLAQSVKFPCRNVDDLENFLHDYLQAPTVPAEHATIEFAFPVSSAFMVYTADLRNKKSAVEDAGQQRLYGKLERAAISVIDALALTEDPKDQMRKQKAISKICVEACERADGFRYSFHNNWLSREDEACRFSYFCNDSTLNKGRAANEGAGMMGKKMRKPVYDCQGLIAVKFSATKQSLEIHYKHVPLHKTYAERAPPPRRDSKRRKLTEASEPGGLPAPQQARAEPRPPGPKRPIGRPRKTPVTELAATSTRGPCAETARENSLHPLVEFLGSTGTINAVPDGNGVSHVTPTGVTGGPQPQTVSDPLIAQHSSSVTSTPQKQTPVKAKRPTIPGSMVGSVHNGILDWSPQSTHKENGARISRRSTTTAKDSTSGAADANSTAAAGTANIALSELEALKQKLEEAEQRIRRLESEKMPVPQLSRPQHVLWPPPPGYPTPYPPPPYPLPDHQFPSAQMAPVRSLPQHPPPRPPHSLPNSQPLVAEPPTIMVPAPPPPAPPAIQKPVQNKPVNPNFVLYAPKNKRTTSSRGASPMVPPRTAGEG